MNFLAHLYLAGTDDGLRLGALLGDFIRGSLDDSNLPDDVQRGIQLHRFIDQHLDSMPQMADLRQHFPSPFRRYSGIIIDVIFDHELALRWEQFSEQSLARFDRDVRDLLARHNEFLPGELRQFMRYADRRGLFAAYASRDEVLFSLAGVGRRLSRKNPLDRVAEIWDDCEPRLSRGFEEIFPLVRQAVQVWKKENAALTAA